MISAGDVEVAQVGAGVALTGGARAGVVERPLGSSPSGVLDGDLAAAGEQLAVARVAAGHHAVEHVDAGADAADQIGRGADAHQVAGLVGRQQGGGGAHRALDVGRRLAHRNTADGDAVEGQSRHVGGRFGAQFREASALHDAEPGDVVAAAGGDVARCPGAGACHGLGHLGLAGLARRALV